MLAGKNFWETIGYPGKGVPSLKVSMLTNANLNFSPDI